MVTSSIIHDERQKHGPTYSPLPLPKRVDPTQTYISPPKQDNSAPAPVTPKPFVNPTISEDYTNPAQAQAKRKLFVNSTISDDYRNLAEAPAKRKLFINSTISEDCTNSDARSSSLLIALKDRPRRFMIKSSGIETGDQKRIRLR
jgi:hypothetical protein